jgi:hypothetical protein
MSARSSIGCVQNDYRAYGTFGVNSAPLLLQDWHNLPTDQNELPLEPRHLGAPYGTFDANSAPILNRAPILN